MYTQLMGWLVFSCRIIFPQNLSRFLVLRVMYLFRNTVTVYSTCIYTYVHTRTYTFLFHPSWLSQPLSRIQLFLPRNKCCIENPFYVKGKEEETFAREVTSILGSTFIIIRNTLEWHQPTVIHIRLCTRIVNSHFHTQTDEYVYIRTCVYL